MNAVFTILENLNKLSKKFQSLLSILFLIGMVSYLVSGWYGFTNRIERSLERVEAGLADIRNVELPKIRGDIQEIRGDVEEMRREIRDLDIRLSKVEVKVDMINARKDP